MIGKIKIHYIPLAFILFTITYMALDGVFIYLANRTYNGVVTTNAYQKGLAFNEVLQANKAQEKLGWQTKLEIAYSDSALIITFKLNDRQQLAIGNAEVKAMLQRPTHEGEDISFTMQEREPGIYRASLPKVEPGQWELRIKTKAQNTEYYHHQRLKLMPLVENL